MPPRKAPADHLAKQNGPGSADSLEELEEYWSFHADGKIYVMPNKTLDVIITPDLFARIADSMIWTMC